MLNVHVQVKVFILVRLTWAMSIDQQNFLTLNEKSVIFYYKCISSLPIIYENVIVLLMQKQRIMIYLVIVWYHIPNQNYSSKYIWNISV